MHGTAVIRSLLLRLIMLYNCSNLILDRIILAILIVAILIVNLFINLYSIHQTRNTLACTCDAKDMCEARPVSWAASRLFSEHFNQVLGGLSSNVARWVKDRQHTLSLSSLSDVPLVATHTLAGGFLSYKYDPKNCIVFNIAMWPLSAATCHAIYVRQAASMTLAWLMCQR